MVSLHKGLNSGRSYGGRLNGSHDLEILESSIHDSLRNILANVGSRLGYVVVVSPEVPSESADVLWIHQTHYQITPKVLFGILIALSRGSIVESLKLTSQTKDRFDKLIIVVRAPEDRNFLNELVASPHVLPSYLDMKNDVLIYTVEELLTKLDTLTTRITPITQTHLEFDKTSYVTSL